MAPFKDVTREQKTLSTLPENPPSGVTTNVAADVSNVAAEVSNVAADVSIVAVEVSNVAAEVANVAAEASNVAAEASNVAAEVAATAQDGKGNIVQVTLQHDCGSSLGFEIEGGSDTYIYIKSIAHNSPASNCGQFNVGDQLVMVGDTCLIGMSYAEAKQALDLAPGTVEVVAQRKALSQPLTDSKHPPVTDDQNGSRAATVVDTDTSAGNGLTRESIAAGEPGILESAESTDDLTETRSNTNNLRGKKSGLIHEERMTVELTRGPREKLGIRIIGGIDHPNLRHIHVSLYA